MTEEAAVAKSRAVTYDSWLGPMRSLLRPDSEVQLRSYRSLLLGFALPLVILIVTHLGRAGRISRLA